MPTTFTGGCLCGRVRYECSAEPFFMGNCVNHGAGVGPTYSIDFMMGISNAGPDKALRSGFLVAKSTV